MSSIRFIPVRQLHSVLPALRLDTLHLLIAHWSHRSRSQLLWFPVAQRSHLCHTRALFPLVAQQLHPTATPMQYLPRWSLHLWDPIPVTRLLLRRQAMLPPAQQPHLVAIQMPCLLPSVLPLLIHRRVDTTFLPASRLNSQALT